jgi:endonuclease YncB( thermonuclease family)
MWILILALILGSAASAYVFMVLILQSAAHEMQKRKAAGLLAKEFVEDALHVGGTYTLTTREKGKFGRYLGVIMLSDRTSINAALVTVRHLAVPYHGQSKQEIEDAHAANYEILKDKGWLESNHRRQ